MDAIAFSSPTPTHPSIVPSLPPQALPVAPSPPLPTPVSTSPSAVASTTSNFVSRIGNVFKSKNGVMITAAAATSFLFFAGFVYKQFLAPRKYVNVGLEPIRHNTFLILDFTEFEILIHKEEEEEEERVEEKHNVSPQQQHSEGQLSSESSPQQQQTEEQKQFFGNQESPQPAAAASVEDGTSAASETANEEQQQGEEGQQQEPKKKKRGFRAAMRAIARWISNWRRKRVYFEDLKKTLKFASQDPRVIGIICYFGDGKNLKKLGVKEFMELHQIILEFNQLAKNTAAHFNTIDHFQTYLLASAFSQLFISKQGSLFFQVPSLEHLSFIKDVDVSNSEDGAPISTDDSYILSLIEKNRRVDRATVLTKWHQHQFQSSTPQQQQQQAEAPSSEGQTGNATQQQQPQPLSELLPTTPSESERRQHHLTCAQALELGMVDHILDENHELMLDIILERPEYSTVEQIYLIRWKHYHQTVTANLRQMIAANNALHRTNTKLLTIPQEMAAYDQLLASIAKKRKQLVHKNVSVIYLDGKVISDVEESAPLSPEQLEYTKWLSSFVLFTVNQRLAHAIIFQSPPIEHQSRCNTETDSCQEDKLIVSDMLNRTITFAQQQFNVLFAFAEVDKEYIHETTGTAPANNKGFWTNMTEDHSQEPPAKEEQLSKAPTTYAGMIGKYLTFWKRTPEPNSSKVKPFNDQDKKNVPLTCDIYCRNLNVTTIREILGQVTHPIP